jgi:hypothetical protein
MKTAWFTIETDNITAFPTEEEALNNPNMRFAFTDRSSLETILSENEGLAAELLGGMTVAAEVPADGWESLPAKKAAKVIWDGIQPLVSAVHPPKKATKAAKPARVLAQSPVAASKAPNGKRKATAKKKAAKAPKKAKVKAEKKPRTKRVMEASVLAGPREGTKAAKLVELLRRPEGVTLAQIVKKFDWLPHTTRGLLSAGGALRKAGIVVESFKSEKGERTYKIAS